MQAFANGSFYQILKFMHNNFKLTHFYRKTYFNTRIFFYKQNLLRSGTFYTKSSVCKDFFIQRFYTYSHTNHFETQIFLGHKKTQKYFYTQTIISHMHIFTKADGVPCFGGTFSTRKKAPHG